LLLVKLLVDGQTSLSAFDVHFFVIVAVIRVLESIHGKIGQRKKGKPENWATENATHEKRQHLRKPGKKRKPKISATKISIGKQGNGKLEIWKVVFKKTWTVVNAM